MNKRTREPAMKSTTAAPLDAKKTLKKGAISGERYPQLLSGNFLGRFPLFLKRASLLREALRQPLHQLRHQLIGLFYGQARLVNETGLNIPPSVAKLLVYTLGEKRF